MCGVGSNLDSDDVGGVSGTSKYRSAGGEDGSSSEPLMVIKTESDGGGGGDNSSPSASSRLVVNHNQIKMTSDAGSGEDGPPDDLMADVDDVAGLADADGPENEMLMVK